MNDLKKGVSSLYMRIRRRCDAGEEKRRTARRGEGGGGFVCVKLRKLWKLEMVTMTMMM